MPLGMPNACDLQDAINFFSYDQRGDSFVPRWRMRVASDFAKVRIHIMMVDTRNAGVRRATEEFGIAGVAGRARPDGRWRNCSLRPAEVRSWLSLPRNSESAPQRPYAGTGRPRARLPLPLPVQALLIGARWLFASGPAQAQSSDATLRARTVEVSTDGVNFSPVGIHPEVSAAGRSFATAVHSHVRVAATANHGDATLMVGNAVGIRVVGQTSMTSGLQSLAIALADSRQPGSGRSYRARRRRRQELLRDGELRRAGWHSDARQSGLTASQGTARTTLEGTDHD